MDNFNLQGYIASGKLHATSETLTEAKKQGKNKINNEGVMWHWDGDRNSLEEVPVDFKAAVKAKIGSLDVGSFDTAFDGIKNFHADEAGQGEQTFNSDLWADQIEMDFSQENAVKENEEEELELDADYDKGGKYYSEDGAEAFNIQPFKMNDVKYTKHEANRMGKYIVGLEGEELKKFISDYMGAFEAGKGDTATGKTFKEGLVDFEGNDIYQEIKGDMKRYYKMDVSMDVIKDWANDYFPNRYDDKDDYEFETSAREDFLNHLEDIKDSNASDEDKELQKQVDIQAKAARRRTKRTRDLAMAKGLSMDDYFDSIDENARTDAEEEGYKDGIKDEKEDAKKMKVSELKAKIKETILAELSLSEADEEVDVDIDVEDEVEVEAGADDIEIERPGVKTTVDVGLSPEEEVVQDSLKAAMDAANELGNQKLADQIGNTITFFTREFVVGQNTD